MMIQDVHRPLCHGNQMGQRLASLTRAAIPRVVPSAKYIGTGIRRVVQYANDSAERGGFPDQRPITLLARHSRRQVQLLLPQIANHALSHAMVTEQLE